MGASFRQTICTKAGAIIYIGILNLKVKFLFSVVLALFSFTATAQTCLSNSIALDHIIWAVPDLEEGMQDFRERTGIDPVYGGEHTNGVTANYLASLGSCLYLEIVGPKAGANLVDLGERAGGYTEPNISGFAFRYNLDETGEVAAKALGINLGAVNEGGRIKPDGSALAWRTAGLVDLNFGPGKFQFIINWLSEPHPATTSPEGASLVTLTLAGDGVRALKGIVEEQNLPIVLQPAGRKGIWMMLDTPKGRVIFK